MLKSLIGIWHSKDNLRIVSIERRQPDVFDWNCYCLDSSCLIASNESWFWPDEMDTVPNWYSILDDCPSSRYIHALRTERVAHLLSAIDCDCRIDKCEELTTLIRSNLSGFRITSVCPFSFGFSFLSYPVKIRLRTLLIFPSEEWGWRMSIFSSEERRTIYPESYSPCQRQTWSCCVWCDILKNLKCNICSERGLTYQWIRREVEKASSWEFTTFATSPSPSLPSPFFAISSQVTFDASSIQSCVITRF